MRSTDGGPGADMVPCPVCGLIVGRQTKASDDQSVVDDPLLPTPISRLCALAAETGSSVGDVPDDDCAGAAGCVAVGVDDQGQVHGMVLLSDALDDGLRADVLAFAVATLAAEPQRVIDAPDGWLAIGRDRLPAARRGVGHLAWHMARSCGRDTPSATFEVLS
jgi:hypothetical protein